MSLQSEIDALRLLSHELLHLGLNDEPIYADRFRALNSEVYRQSELLFPKKGDSPKEEAALCVALLRGYSATIYNDGNKEERIQSVLDRSWAILEHLPTSLLKCKLLVACYGEVFEEELLEEVRKIVDGWEGRDLLKEEKAIIETLSSLDREEVIEL